MTASSFLRPCDLAACLLAASDAPPRQRARDQAPDLAGLALKRRLLERLAELDPPPEQMEATLMHIVAEFGPPTGPSRAIALGIQEEWQAACASPAFANHLRAAAEEGRRAR